MEFGTHEELMELNGRYRYLYGLQTDALADVSISRATTDGSAASGQGPT